MNWSFGFFINSILLGVGLAMDAFSVSLANGLQDPKMKKTKMAGIAGVFAGFQALMPMIGWGCVHTMMQHFKTFEKFIPWIALFLLVFIGRKMLMDGIKNKEEEEEAARLIVKVERKGNDVEYAQRSGATHQKIQRHKAHKQKQKQTAVEYERCRAVVHEQVTRSAEEFFYFNG